MLLIVCSPPPGTSSTLTGRNWKLHDCTRLSCRAMKRALRSARSSARACRRTVPGANSAEVTGREGRWAKTTVPASSIKTDKIPFFFAVVVFIAVVVLLLEQRFDRTLVGHGIELVGSDGQYAFLRERIDRQRESIRVFGHRIGLEGNRPAVGVLHGGIALHLRHQRIERSDDGGTCNGVLDIRQVDVHIRRFYRQHEVGIVNGVCHAGGHLLELVGHETVAFGHHDRVHALQVGGIPRSAGFDAFRTARKVFGVGNQDLGGCAQAEQAGCHHKE